MRPNAPSFQTVLVVLAWLVLIGLAAATLVPLDLRPHSSLSPQVERFLAFALAGLCLALAYPRRPILIIVAIVVTALGLEAAQFFAISRHPGVPDLFAKLAGGGAGLVLGWGLRAVVTGLRRA